MHIEQLSRITRVSLHHIRQYEQLGLLPALDAKGGYGEPHVHALKLIKTTLGSGLSLREVIHMITARDFDEFSRRQQDSIERLNQRRGELDPSKTGEFTKIEAINSLEKDLNQIRHEGAILPN